MRILGRKAVCPVCGTTYQREKLQRSSRVVVELTDLDVARMLARARSNPRDFAILGFLASGFRRSEVVGGDDNGVELPGVHAEDILLEQQGVRVVGKGQSPAIREGREPKRILQPVPRIFLEAVLSRGFEKGRVFEGTNTHQVGELVKEYARLATVAEWEEVRAHRLRHWYSNAVRKRIGNQGPTALLEWADTMRHSRKAAQSVTVAFYSGELTSFERRLEICLAAFHPVLEQLQSPTFLASLPAPAPLPIPPPKQNDTPLVRVQRNSTFSERQTSSERGTVPDGPIVSITSSSAAIVTLRDSKPDTAPVDQVEPVTAKPDEPAPEDPSRVTEPVDEPPAAEPVADPFSEEASPEPEPVVELPPETVPEIIAATTSEPEPPVSAPRLLGRLEIMLAWQRIRHEQRDLIQQQKLWKKFRCSVSGCKQRIVARDEAGWVCETHCSTLHQPPPGWLPPLPLT